MFIRLHFFIDLQGLGELTDQLVAQGGGASPRSPPPPQSPPPPTHQLTPLSTVVSSALTSSPAVVRPVSEA